MSPSKIVAFSLVVMLVGNASAALAKLVRQYVGATPGGEPELMCVYCVDSREFERRYPIGNWCPEYAEGSESKARAEMPDRPKPVWAACRVGRARGFSSAASTSASGVSDGRDQRS